MIVHKVACIDTMPMTDRGYGKFPLKWYKCLVKAPTSIMKKGGLYVLCLKRPLWSFKFFPFLLLYVYYILLH